MKSRQTLLVYFGWLGSRQQTNKLHLSWIEKQLFLDAVILSVGICFHFQINAPL